MLSKPSISAGHEEIAGRKVKCTACDQKMRLPADPDHKIEPIGPLLSKANKASTGAYELDLSDSIAASESEAEGKPSGGGQVSEL